MNDTKTKKFIEKAKEVHGDKYDYSKAEYRRAHDKICIICPEHGEFWQDNYNHLKGCGCPKCGVEKVHEQQRKTTEQFIKDARKVHGDRYDYSKVNYINDATPVTIVCKTHGEFKQIPRVHLSGGGCNKCSIISTHNKQRKTKETFIADAKRIHGNKFDYSKVNYVNAKTKVCIVCPKHGEFWQTPTDHLKGRGCQRCAGKGRELDDMINEFNLVHNFKYDYSLVDSTSAKEKIDIICPFHGKFRQTVEHHRIGCGCPKCKTSTLEKKLMCELDKRSINYEYQKTFEWLMGKVSLRYDFYLPEYGVAIECQGIQHFKSINFFGGIDGLKETQERDKLKKELSKEHGIKVFYYSNLGIEYPYQVYENIEELINDIKNYATD